MMSGPFFQAKSARLPSKETSRSRIPPVLSSSSVVTTGLPLERSNMHIAEFLGKCRSSYPSESPSV